MKTEGKSTREDKLATSTHAEAATVASGDQGAEVASAVEREAVADDYEVSARVGAEDREITGDYSDEEFTFDRPDTAAMAAEEGGKESTAG